MTRKSSPWTWRTDRRGEHGDLVVLQASGGGACRGAASVRPRGRSSCSQRFLATFRTSGQPSRLRQMSWKVLLLERKAKGDLRRAISAARSPPQPASSSRAPPARLIATPVRGSTTRPPEPVPAAPSTGSLLDAHLHCNALYRLRIFHVAPPGVPPVTTAIPSGETSAGRARNHGDHRREGVGGRGPVGRTRRSSPGGQELIRPFVG